MRIWGAGAGSLPCSITFQEGVNTIVCNLQLLAARQLCHALPHAPNLASMHMWWMPACDCPCPAYCPSVQPEV